MATSFSRLGTANTYDLAMRNLTARQTKLADLQENLTSGKRVVRPSDDPTGAAQAERSLTRLARIATDQRALEAQKNSIASAESTLGDITSALQRFRELTVSAGNGNNTAAERRTIAVELQGLREQVLTMANRKDNNGLPLFAALGSGQVPFAGPNSPPADYSFLGLPGQAAASENAIPGTLDGESAFMLQGRRDGAYNVTLSQIPTDRTLQTSAVTVVDPTLVNGSSYSITIDAVSTVAGTTTVTYSVAEGPPVAGPTQSGLTASFPSNLPPSFTITAMPGLSMTVNGLPVAGDTITVDTSPSIFSVMDDAIRDIGTAVNANAASQAVAQALGNLDIGMERVSAVRGQAGDLLNRADRITSTQESRSIQLEADRSRAEDLDMIKGIADFQNQQTGYSAALQSYAQVQKLSLFNFIG
ncbi:flagellar hook-associated protein FlgL [Rhodoferax sp.]|uniref:flagellar hook-associated protein FlgL n=1 Tax=Rhodoferax sp. TaxID=50421 RepID=UPI002ACE5313|nr:flagellar hook-associated protein FlgL [Rhodoferax sp.]MDZ7919955.1 flagellar hook-associated protein FlgL [Rhodoferax sp.]